MSNFPNESDNDVTLPPINNDIAEIGGDAINALRDAVLNIEDEIGFGSTSSTRASGTAGSIALRLATSLDPDGYIIPSALTGLGLVALPIYNTDIAPNAAIKESKLDLDYGTQTLFNNILGLSQNVNVAIGWLNSTGIKLTPHINGIEYRHEMSHVDVSADTNDYFKNRFSVTNPNEPSGLQSEYRNNTNLYQLFNDLNNDYLIHQKSDGYEYNASIQNIHTLDGYHTYPSNFAHAAGGVHLDTFGYEVIPQAINSVQKFADYIDANSIFLLGTRMQNLYSNAISRTSSSNILALDGYGSPVVPPTKVTTYLMSVNPTAPNDNPATGDDIILFTPSGTAASSFTFDSQFAGVKVGDVIRVNYGSVQTEFLIKEIKNIIGTPSTYAVRIAGKNLFATTDGYARIDRPLFNPAKYGVLAVSAAQVLDGSGNNSLASIPSVIVSHPRGAVALGNGFDSGQIDQTNYNLNLVLYPNGDITNSIQLAPIDITGNLGTTPGLYTLDYIVEATNNSFRKAGYNYRFAAFSYNGQFGIMLTDSYNNAAFSIIAGKVNISGTAYDQSTTAAAYPNNIIQYNGSGDVLSDPLGFGVSKANIASPTYSATYTSTQIAFGFPTRIFLPLKRNNYYVNGTEKENFAADVHQSIDNYGDGYWQATVVARSIEADRISLTYRVNHDLSTSGLAVGKTLVAQSLGEGNVVDYGRYTISDISIITSICSPDGYYTDITVWDCIQGNISTNGVTPPVTIPIDMANTGSVYALYFNGDSVTFNSQNAFTGSQAGTYKRHFEIYTDQAGKTFSLERGRMNITASTLLVAGASLYSDTNLKNINIERISPKLRGYTNGTTVSSITLKITSYDSTSNIFTGLLMNGNSGANSGPTITGKKGEVVRFYDETNIDYIDFIFNINDSIPSFTDEYISIQLFPTLDQDQEVFLLASCQVNNSTNIVNYVKDLRQFGSIAEKDLSTSVFNFMSTPERLIHANGVVRGFEITIENTTDNFATVTGGIALVNGKFIQLNNTIINIPPVQEYYSATDHAVFWALCANDKNEFQLIPLLDYSGASLTRTFIARDVSSPSTYELDAVSFVDLINYRKDLTPLHLINSNVVAGPTYSNVSSFDVRKFINDEPINNTLTWTSEDGGYPGNFHSFSAATVWVELYGNVTNVIKVRGTVDTTLMDLSTNLTKSIVFEGDSNGATINISGATSFNKNIDVTFRNINLNFTGASQTITRATGGTGKLILENVTITGTTFGALTFGDYVTFDNVTITGTTFGALTFGSEIQLNNVTFSGTSTGSIIFGENIIINNTNITTSGTINLITFGLNCQLNMFNVVASNVTGAISFGNVYINKATFPSSAAVNIGLFSSRSNIVDGYFGNIAATASNIGLFVTDNNYFNNCYFGNISSVNGITFSLSNYNIFDNCTFGTIEGTGTSIKTLDIGIENKFNGCTFGDISSNVGTGLVINSKNIINNCTFADIVHTSTGTRSSSGAVVEVIGNYNLITNSYFSNIQSLYTGSSNEYTIYIVGKYNNIDNVNISTINNSSTGAASSALYVYGTNNTINKLIVIGESYAVSGVTQSIWIDGQYTKITNSNLLIGSSGKGIVGSANYFTFNNNIFSYSYVNTPVVGLGYTNGGIYFYSSVEEIELNNNTFILVSDTTNPPAISFNLPKGTTVNNVNINNNKFYDAGSAGNYVGAISFIANNTGGSSTAATLSNINIDKNFASDFGLFLIGTASAGATVGPGLAVENVNVTNNSFKKVGINIVSSANSKLLIDGNTIQNIESINSTVNSFITSNAYGTGNITIVNNHLSSINRFLFANYGTSGDTEASIIIDTNKFYPYGSGGHTDAAIYMQNARNQGEATAILIKNNIVAQGSLSRYTTGFHIHGDGTHDLSFQITGNSIGYFDSYGLDILKWSGAPSIISNNILTRGSESITAYIYGNDASGIHIDSKCLVVDNAFDSPYTTGTSYTDVIKDVPPTWVVERNINQTVATTFFGNVGNYSINTPDTEMGGYFDETVIAGNYDAAITPGTTIMINTNTQLLRFSKPSGAGGKYTTFVWSIDARDILPNNITILELEQKFYPNEPMGSSAVKLEIYTNASTTPDVAGTNGLGSDITLTLSTPQGLPYYLNNSKRANIRLSLTMGGLNTDTYVRASTLTIIYRW